MMRLREWISYTFHFQSSSNKKGINPNLCSNIIVKKFLTKEIYAMLIITQDSTDEITLIDCIKKLFLKYHKNISYFSILISQIDNLS